MRGPMKQVSSATRRKRQVLIAAMLFAASPNITSPLMAGQPVARPPLPLSALANPGDTKTVVKVNPFCLPEPTSALAPMVLSPIVLASGTEVPAIRLQPIGKAIGLHGIDEGPLPHTGMPAITVETPAPMPVQTNPLVDQQPAKPKNSSIILLPRKSAGSILVEPQPLTDPVSVPVASLATSSTEESLPMVSEADTATEVTSPVKEEQPSEAVYFSLSDDSEQSDLGSPDEPSASATPETGSDHSSIDSLAMQLEAGLSNAGLSNEKVVESMVAAPAIPPTVVSPPAVPEAMVPEAIVQLPKQPNILDRVIQTKPINENEIANETGVGKTQENQFFQQGSAIAKLVASPESNLQSRRYRPPVDVHPIPLAFQDFAEAPELQIETADDSGSGAGVTQTQRLVAQSPATPLYLHRAQVRSLTLGAELQSVKIADKNVCQAFSSGPNQLKLIGTGNGVTRLVVFAKPMDGESTPRVRTFEIHVKDAVEITENHSGDKTQMLNQSIQQAFPEADVFVQRNGSELTVLGRCGSEATAKKIIRMVRKTCLVPVKDQLQVR